jgi:hypothetical protein
LKLSSFDAEFNSASNTDQRVNIMKKIPEPVANYTYVLTCS